MPALDVSELLLDPDFAEPLTIQRRVDNVRPNGRNAIAWNTVFPAPYGVVLPKDTALAGNELERAPDGQYRGAALTVHTKFRLRGPSPGYQPDVMVWEGDPYVCTLVNNYSHYGAGFVQAEFTSMPTIDHPPR